MKAFRAFAEGYWELQFKAAAYIWGGGLLVIAVVLAYAIPPVDRVVARYQAGRTGFPAAMRSGIGTVVPFSALLYVGRSQIEINQTTILELIALYLVGTAMGWLALRMLADYRRKAE